MSTSIVVGLQYGDEGKARFVDQLCPEHDIVVRFNGGANAGHTVVVGDQRVALKQIPSGVFYPKKKLYIGSGCAVNIAKLAQEIEELANAGLQVGGRLRIAARALVIQPHHVLLDQWLGKKVGTTGNGIGPAYADRCYRMWGEQQVSISIGDLAADPDKYYALMKTNLERVCNDFALPAESGSKELAAVEQSFRKIRQYLEPDPLYLQKEQRAGSRILAEGAQAVMLDVAQGTVPYVTASRTISSAAFTGGDIAITDNVKRIGIAKAIMSRVGHGPFVSEYGSPTSESYCMARNDDGTPKYGRQFEASLDHEKLLASADLQEMSKAIRYYSGEYGTVTTRPRRVGGLDLVQLRYAVEQNQIDELILTKCDLLNLYSRTAKAKIPLVIGYKLNGKHLDYYPATTGVLQQVEPVWEYHDAFAEDISDIRKAMDLPQVLHSLLTRISDFVGCPIRGIGVGPERTQYVSLT